MRLKIDKVDRTNTDPKLLACKIIAKEDKKVKLACVHGIINQWFTINVLVDLSAVPHELAHLQLDDLPEISMITLHQNYMFEVLSMVSVVHAKEDARPSSVLVKKIKFSIRQSVIKIVVVIKTWKNKKQFIVYLVDIQINFHYDKLLTSCRSAVV